jgi:hypothetical protein
MRGSLVSKEVADRFVEADRRVEWVLMRCTTRPERKKLTADMRGPARPEAG